MGVQNSMNKKYKHNQKWCYSMLLFKFYHIICRHFVVVCY